MTAHPQCKLCQMGVSTEPGLSQTAIGKKYGVHRRSVQRHLNHLGEQDEPDTSVTLTTQQRARTVLDVNGSEGTAEVDVDTDLDRFFKDRGIDPSAVEITSRRVSEWQANVGGEIKTLRSQKVGFHLKPVTEDMDLPAMFASVERVRERIKVEVDPKPLNRGTVVVWADPQTGKVDRGGDTRDLIERLAFKREKLQHYIETHPASSGHFLNIGDSVENIQNTSSQIATNDLSLVEQIDLESTFETEFIGTLAENYGQVQVGVVPSNHCQLRQGKGLIGKPGDDWGIHIVRQIEKQFRYGHNYEAFKHVNFLYPEDKWIESMVVDVEGTNIGIVHGHQKTQPNAIPAWWAGQVHGALLADAEILITGHFHHFIARQTGVHIRTGRDKYHLQAPALDNGSAWYQNVSGESSKPGLMVFQVDENGFDLGSLDIL